jgi:hypothetical protein
MKLFDPTKTDDELIDAFAAGDEHADAILSGLSSARPDDFRKALIDLDDMEMSGDQIVEARVYSLLTGESHETNTFDLFVTSIKERDEDLVSHVNAYCPRRTARRHGEQKALPSIAGAVKAILGDDASAEAVRRVDIGADAVHDFFKLLLEEMQQRRHFVSNFRLNLDVEGWWGVFTIQLVDIVDRDGNSINVNLEKKDGDHLSASTGPHGTAPADDAAAAPAGGNRPVARGPAVGVPGDAGGAERTDG